MEGGQDAKQQGCGCGRGSDSQSLGQGVGARSSSLVLLPCTFLPAPCGPSAQPLTPHPLTPSPPAASPSPPVSENPFPGFPLEASGSITLIKNRLLNAGFFNAELEAGAWGAGAMPGKRTPGGAGRPALQRNSRFARPGARTAELSRGPSQRLTSRAQMCGRDPQAAVDVLAALLLFVDVLIFHVALAALDDVLVRNGFIQVLPGQDSAAFHEEPVLMQVSE